MIDEYHLYDEEQIANILVWLMTSYRFFKNIKWFFTSATPEPLLFKLLDSHGIKPRIIQQDLADSGRVIQGKQKIHFIGVSSHFSLYKWMFENEKIRDDVKEKISDAIKNGKRVFLLFDSLREAKIAENKIRDTFRDAKVGINTGFETRQKDFEFNPEDYDIIITTSKAEVGVNYPVQLAYIDSGRYLRSFLQRIGRIGRGQDESEIYCVAPVFVVEKIKGLVKNENSIDYYNFVDVLNHSFEDVKLKEKIIGAFAGALLWSVYNSLKYPERRKVIEDLIEKFQYSRILFELDKLIEKAKEEMEEKFYENLKIFWNTFKRSFMRFREDTMQWKILYKNQETEYDIIWILNNAFIEEICRKKKWVIINDFRPKNEKIVKGIITRSLLEDPYAEGNCQQIGGTKSEQEKEWREFLYSDHIGNLYANKLEKWLKEVEVSKELKELLKKLRLVYSKKRIEVFDVLYDYKGVKNAFII